MVQNKKKKYILNKIEPKQGIDQIQTLTFTKIVNINPY